jgi:hypothetical protein
MPEHFSLILLLAIQEVKLYMMPPHCISKFTSSFIQNVLFTKVSYSHKGSLGTLCSKRVGFEARL